MATTKPEPGRSDQTQTQPPPSQISFLSTGTVRIRPSMRSQPITNQSVLMRRLRSFADRGWSEDMPIGVFLISHPDGPILFDTGESPHRNDPGFLPWWSPTYLLNTVSISRDDGIVSQLRARGVEPSTLQAVVLSHLHGDHAGGLQDLAEAAPDVPIYVSREHWEAFGHNPLHAKIQGCNPQHWPANFTPRILERTDDAVGPWKQSTKLTRDGRVVVVDTPGHVPGHVSLVVYGDDGENHGKTYFLVGDATYGLDLLDKEEPDGINDDPQTALESLRLIKQFARETELVVLPSHDPEVERLLRDSVPYKPKDAA
ncbi:hypothetical protein ACO1O0_007612 [Amphichorda felina]